MAPINQSTIHVESWTGSKGKVKTQVVASGTIETPWKYIYVRPINPKDAKRITGENKIVDVNVDKEGKIDSGFTLEERPLGVWKKVKES